MTAKILVVDDEPLLEYVIQQKFRQKIRSKEFEFVFASNGREALEKLVESPSFDLVLTDINMPEMDGLTFLEKLSEIDTNLKVIVVSAYSDLQNIRIAMNRGAFDFLTKPIDFHDMEITLQKSLDAVRQTQEHLAQLQQSQTQLIQHEKMASIGFLIAGVAHEINNPVTFILGNIEHTETYFKDLLRILTLYQNGAQPEEIQAEIEATDLPFILEDLPQILHSMKEGAERIRRLSTSLRVFSRADTATKVPFDIHEGIDSTLLILKHRLKASEGRPEIQVIKDYNYLPDLKCYPGQLNQVFMNILANAIDALEERNQRYSSAELKENPSQITISTFLTKDENWGKIRIADNGPGMPPEIIKQAFHYLFTTKPPGKGTGLGLAISRSIVEEKHGGTLRCSSTPGEGAEFVIELPI